MDLTRQIYSKNLEALLPVRQMLFLTGPRQVGKTTLVKRLLKAQPHSLYLNWDVPDDRKVIQLNAKFYQAAAAKHGQRSLVALDEIHKKSGWKNFLKGLYDEASKQCKFICTGSGRLDLFQKGGDSLAGRYLLFHLWPLTLGELLPRGRSLAEFLQEPHDVPPETSEARQIWNRLASRSGFPDPFLAEQDAFYPLWSDAYRNQLVREDIRDASKIMKLDLLETLVWLLPSKVGSPLSIDNLASDLGVAFETVKSWLVVLERFFLIFRIKPWTAKISRAVTKEQKLYLFDFPKIETESARFEAMIAVELLRATTTWTENGLGSFELRYARTRDKDEVDFLITRNRKPLLLVEAKLSDTAVAPSLVKFQKQLRIPAIQLVNQDGVYKPYDHEGGKLLVVSAPRWLAGLP